MKKIIFPIIVIVTVLVAGCTKLDVKVESQYISSNFPTTAADYAAVIGPIYSQLSSRYAIEYFRMQELSTDEVLIPGRDGNYDDGGQYRQHHHHTYTKDHTNVKDIWEWGFGGINTCNRIINIINSAPTAENDPTKLTALAEVKSMRALFYFFMLDIYGNIPVVDSFPVIDLPATKPRAEVFQYIENSIKSVMNYLPVKTASNATQTYGHPTRGMAFALLAKLYINAEVYTGSPRNADAVAMCDSIIASKSYELDASYASVFAPDNGPQIKETIFAVPYDPLLIPGQQFTRHGFMAYLYPKYGVPSNLSVSMSTTPDFYNLFNLTGDERNATWLIGKQYNLDGSPFTLTIKKKDLNASYSGTNNDTTWQLEITKDIIMKGTKPFDVGNDYLARCMGIRSIKYYPDKATTAATRMSGNDMHVFRLADIYLLKAEAILRGAAATTVNNELQTPVILVNKVRIRAKAITAATIDLQELLDERGRELYWENWRRNDLIRFGKYEVEYPIPGDLAVPGYTPGMDKSANKRIFPVPASELKLNSKLVQNPGYN
jgi:starch-binding outer membrane protein, SusD/RagB family